MATPNEQEQAMIANLAAQTGKSLDEWIGLVRKQGLDKHGEIVALLKSKHSVTHGYANLIAHKALRSDAASADSAPDLIEAQFQGTKAAARPVYEVVLRAVQQFGADIEVAPKKAYVSLRRSKQFALLQPAPGRLDVGINLKGTPAAGRLEASGSFNAMVSHRVRVTSVAEVDTELVDWLRAAYDRA
jgi:hypothetical protein